jgi:hypothetical protein
MFVVSLLLWLVAAVWLVVLARGVYDSFWAPQLPDFATELAAPDPAAQPLVSVVVPARDEGARIGAAIERLLDQRGVALEIIVVDDRSRDDTSTIVRAIAAADPRVRLERVDELPAGWLGKPHACQRGAAAARGEWILFTDGDVFIAPDVVVRALAAARREGAEHVTITAHLDRADWTANAGICGFGALMLSQIAAANRDHPRSGVGIGAFNLVRTDAWRAIGGHTALAFEVVDDLRLGRLLRRGGFRTRAYLGRGEVGAVWAKDALGVVRALEKNMFAELGYDAAKAAAITVVLLALWLGALAGPFTGTTAGWAAFTGYALTTVFGVVISWRLRAPVFATLASPLFGWVLPAAVANSAWVTLRAGGVRWRGTFYPLSELRARRMK